MKKYLVIIIGILIFSCRDTNNKIEKVRFDDGRIYEYYKINNNLTKVIRFFPNTKDTFSISFVNNTDSLKDSIAYFYRKNGTLKMTTKYENKEKYQIITEFRENGITKKGYFVDNKPIVIKFYKNGIISKYIELISEDDKIIGNAEIFFYDKGKINTDSSLFFSLYPTPDSIKLADSINIKFCLLAPKNTITEIVTGNIDKDFYFSSKNPEIKFIDNKEFLYKPETTGYDTVRFISEIGFPDSTVRLLFLKKVFFVTE